MPEVTDIEDDRADQPLMAESVLLINADDAWVAGFTGSGWTVAILHAGVDKTRWTQKWGPTPPTANCRSMTN